MNPRIIRFSMIVNRCPARSVVGDRSHNYPCTDTNGRHADNTDPNINHRHNYKLKLSWDFSENHWHFLWIRNRKYHFLDNDDVLPEDNHASIVDFQSLFDYSNDVLTFERTRYDDVLFVFELKTDVTKRHHVFVLYI